MKRLCLPAGAALLLCGCTHLFFKPTNHIHSDPASEGYAYEPIKFASLDGTPLTGMFFRPPSAPRATVVHFHGNGENMTSHYRYSAWLAKEGYNVFIFDYRGYGASGGKPGLDGAVLDGRAALAHALKLPGADPEKIVVFGQSLGGAIAIAAAAEGAVAPAALVIEGSFYSYRSMARSALKKGILGWPLLWLPGLAVSGRHAPADLAGRLAAPKVFLHSPTDRMVPYSEGRRLYDAARGPKEFWEVPSGHIEAFAAHAPLFAPRLLRFLAAVLPA